MDFPRYRSEPKHSLNQLCRRESARRYDALACTETWQPIISRPFKCCRKIWTHTQQRRGRSDRTEPTAARALEGICKRVGRRSQRRQEVRTVPFSSSFFSFSEGRALTETRRESTGVGTTRAGKAERVGAAPNVERIHPLEDDPAPDRNGRNGELVIATSKASADATRIQRLRKSRSTIACEFLRSIIANYCSCRDFGGFCQVQSVNGESYEMMRSSPE
jgi:hypothetical protein